MNLYKFHSDPEILDHHDDAHQLIPKLFMVGRYNDFPENLSPTQIRAISKDPEYAYKYAFFVLKKRRWPEAEPYIMKDPEYARMYAQRIIAGRWPEAEPYIFKDEDATIFYNMFLNSQLKNMNTSF